MKAGQHVHSFGESFLKSTSEKVSEEDLAVCTDTGRVSPAQDILKKLTQAQSSQAFGASSNETKKQFRSRRSSFETNERMPVGIVDYCLLIGNARRRFSPIHIPPHRQYLVGASNQPSESDDIDVCVWDRFPVQDHTDSPLPLKVYFKKFIHNDIVSEAYM